MASVLEKVRGFVARLAPHPVCDDCIVERLALPEPEAANLNINELAGSDGFERTAAACSLCGLDGTFIRKAR